MYSEWFVSNTFFDFYPVIWNWLCGCISTQYNIRKSLLALYITIFSVVYPVITILQLLHSYYRLQCSWEEGEGKWVLTRALMNVRRAKRHHVKFWRSVNTHFDLLPFKFVLYSSLTLLVISSNCLSSICKNLYFFQAAVNQLWIVKVDWLI